MVPVKPPSLRKRRRQSSRSRLCYDTTGFSAPQQGIIDSRLHPDIDFLVQFTAQSSQLHILAASLHRSPVNAHGVPWLGHFFSSVAAYSVRLHLSISSLHTLSLRPPLGPHTHVGSPSPSREKCDKQMEYAGTLIATTRPPEKNPIISHPQRSISSVSTTTSRRCVSGLAATLGPAPGCYSIHFIGKSAAACASGSLSYATPGFVPLASARRMPPASRSSIPRHFGGFS